jgi:hypothetical protein
MDTEPKQKVSYISEFIVAAGYILFFCLAFAFCSMFYYLSYLQPQPPAINTFATSLPPRTPTPHVLPTDLKNAKIIFKDDFSDDNHHWTRTEDVLKEQVTLGKLLVESQKEGLNAYAECMSCPKLAKPFYFQADFSTGTATDKGFGIVFNVDDDWNNLSMFQINTEARKYFFYRFSDDSWSLLAAGDSDQIKSFPTVNTLGIYANHDTVEFYINGNIVDSYTASGYKFHEGYFNFYVNDSNFKLVVDNLIISSIGK